MGERLSKNGLGPDEPQKLPNSIHCMATGIDCTEAACRKDGGSNCSTAYWIMVGKISEGKQTNGNLRRKIESLANELGVDYNLFKNRLNEQAGSNL